MVVRKLLLILTLLCGLAAPAAAAAASRVALIIANTHYRVARNVPNSIADGSLMADTLAGAGFAREDIVTIVNGDKAHIESALAAFAPKARQAEVALIYFAGHGIELGGFNFLIPVDAGVGDDRHIREETVPLDVVLQAPAGAKLRVIILDACRDDPFSRTIDPARPKGTGLAEVEPGAETLLAYSTRAGTVARDDVTGWDVNSPFATALARRISEPGLEIGMLFRTVRDDVLLATGREQEPIAYGALSSRQFYFLPRPDSAPAVAAAEIEALTWQVATLTGTKDGYQSYLNRFPNGFYADAAREKIDDAARVKLEAASTGARRQPPAWRGGVVAAAMRPQRLEKLVAAYDREVGPACAEALADRFPLVRSSVVDIAGADIFRLLGPGGVFDRFSKDLLPYLETSASPWRWRQDKSASAGLSPDSAKMLGQAAMMRDLLVENVAMTVSLASLDPSIDRAELVIGDQRLIFDGTHKGPYPIVWRFLDGTTRADIRLVRGGQATSLVSEGFWSFFRLIERAERRQTDPKHFTATFGSGTGRFALSFALPGRFNPFDPSFWSLRCADRL